jgi:hypothetical protein
MKKIVALTLLLIVVGIVSYAGYQVFAKKGPSESLISYVESVKERDFQTIYGINHRTQKQVNLVMRRSDDENDKEGLLEKIYDRHKKNFDSITSSDNPTFLWAEKLFFIPEMEYTILQVKRLKEGGSPTSFYRSHSLAIIMVDAAYTNPETAPLYSGKRIKQVKLQVHMILSRDVVKGLRTKPFKKGWLFQGLKIDEENIVYWDSG